MILQIHFFSDSFTPTMDGLIALHDYLFFFLVLIAFFLVWFFIKILSFSFLLNDNLFYRPVNENLFFSDILYSIIYYRNYAHAQILEIIWTIIPVFILILIGVPSFSILYAMDELNDPEGTILVIGHQWYWEYGVSIFDNTVSSYKDEVFDSFMVPTEELNFGERRLLTVDNYISIPERTYFRIAITSADVIHSFAIPGAGIKVDAIPGRLNQTSIFALRAGTFVGQCSELCGVNHRFYAYSS